MFLLDPKIRKDDLSLNSVVSFIVGIYTFFSSVRLVISAKEEPVC